MEQGETPSVLALTNGKADIRDAVMAVMLDDDGNIRTQTKYDNLKDQGDRAAFLELIARRTPRVVVIGGMSVQTAKLRDDVAAALREHAIRNSGENPPIQDAYGSHEEFVAALADFDQRLGPTLIPLIFVSDATAKIYMMSEEAEKEHPSLPSNGRYALALARYTQNPLNAYCKLGRQIASVTFMEHHQKLVSGLRLCHTISLIRCFRSLRRSFWYTLSAVSSTLSASWVSKSIPAWPTPINVRCCLSSPAWDPGRRIY